MSEDARSQRISPWLYKLFTGRQYPYIRRLAKFERKDRQAKEERLEPTPKEIDEKFWEVFPRCSSRILQEVKSGMIVSFLELENYPPGGYQELVDTPEEFLARVYGRKKIKVNFYDGDNFVCTINFKVGGWASHDDD